MVVWLIGEFQEVSIPEALLVHVFWLARRYPDDVRQITDDSDQIRIQPQLFLCPEFLRSKCLVVLDYLGTSGFWPVRLEASRSRH